MTKEIISHSPASFQVAFLLTGGVEHHQDSWMFPQKAIKGLISQMEDRRVCL